MVAAGLAALSAAACSSGAASAPAVGPTDSAVVRNALTAFDASDSRASTAGDLAALAHDETGTALAMSTASVHRNALADRSQPAFSHVDPVFATSTADGCFLVAAGVRSAGTESQSNDLSLFTRGTDGGWKLTDNVQLSPASAAATAGLQPAAVSAAVAVPAAARESIAANLVARSTRGAAAGTSVVAASDLLDGQFAAGWQIYVEQMAKAGMTVSRTTDSVQWSRCAARTGDAVVAFVTVRATDAVTSVSGASAMLPAGSPDLLGLGRRTGVRGRTITVHRVQDYLVSVPSSGRAPAQVLSIADAPTALEVAP